MKLTDNEKLRKMLTDKEFIAQVWAEAVSLYQGGEKPYLSAEAEATAEQEQERHSEADSRTGLVKRYLDKPIPKDWKTYDIFERREYIDASNTVRRNPRPCVRGGNLVRVSRA